MQDAAQAAVRLLPERLRVREALRNENTVIVRFFRSCGKNEQFLQDPSFHLVGRLVREGDGEDAPVFEALRAQKQEPDIFESEVVGFPGPRRCFQYLDHRPQIVLKSQ